MFRGAEAFVQRDPHEQSRMTWAHDDRDLEGSRAPLQSCAYERIEEPLVEQAKRSPQKQAVVEGERSCTYDGLAARARHLAARLQRRGLEPGDRVSIYLDKTTSSVVALYGVWLAGGVAVPVNEGLRSRQVEHIVRHSESRLFV